MAGIYNRDNINYSSMLMAALKDRAETAARQAAYKERMGKIWGDATKSVGNMVGRGIMASADAYGGDSSSTVDEDKAELKQLEELQKQQEEMEKQREAAAKEMVGYVPNSVSPEAVRAAEQMNGYRPFDTREGAYIAPQVGGAESVAMNGYHPILNHTPSTSEIEELAYRDKMKGIYGVDVPAHYPEDYYTDPYYYGLDLSNPYSNAMQNYYRRGR